MTTLKEIAKILKQCKSAVIFTHTRPDGDTIGGAMALSRALSFCGIENEVLSDGEIPERFDYLDGVKEIKTSPSFDAECFICIDSSTESRLGLLRDTFLAGVKKKITVNVDHHISNTHYAKYNFVRDRASNCENILELIKELGAPITKEISEFLMTGMVTDSGGFSHNDVNGDSFRAAGEVADAGADVCKISYEVMKKQTRPRAQFYLKALSRLRFLLDDKLTAVVVPQALLDEFGLKPDATEGLVDFGLTIESTEVSTCFLEVKKGQYKVSFRSKGKVNVNEVAGVFGGGGHILASGCVLFGEEEEVVEKIKYAVWQRL
ncbi:MAG: bifunctional oligoribonuclease/PAP phosphatase NrnA [Clostridia bacterium]|nr:bifunctional oligoribonuclease/PAP phosphatase NrnA [Clostridia bacterium]